MELAKKYQKFTPEFREEIAKLVVEGQSLLPRSLANTA
jgi:hypothetical protein